MGFFMAAAALFSCHAQKPQHPNVIVILADDVGFGDVSCNGSKTISTPHVDRVAKEGIRFTNAHTTSSTSTPARYALLTGKYPWRTPGTGIATGDAGMIIRPEQYTLADMFRNQGYATCALGKWHLGLGDKQGTQNWNGQISPALSDVGFDYSFIMAATGDRVPCVWIENGRVVNLDPADPIQVSYRTPFPGEPVGRDHPELLRVLPSSGHDQAIVNGIGRIGYMKGGKSALWVDEEIADVITGKAVKFITDNKTKPFFLYMATHDIHVPRLPNERFVGKSGMGPRGDAILSFDASVGAVLDALDELGLADNTLVILSSDNGPVVDDGYRDQATELLGEHRPWGIYRGCKYTIFEAGTRVPFLVRWPAAVKSSAVQDALVSQIDMMASLASLTGCNLPEGAAPDSRNAIQTLLGKSREGREFAVEQNLSNTLALYEGEWKFVEISKNKRTHSAGSNIEYGNSQIPMLFNLKNDVSETTDVAALHPDVVETMSRKLESIKTTYDTGGKAAPDDWILQTQNK